MKYLKISMLNKKLFSDQCLSFFKIVCKSSIDYEFLGNSIRRALLQDLV